jgi:hypothetical protein
LVSVEPDDGSVVPVAKVASFLLEQSKSDDDASLHHGDEILAFDKKRSPNQISPGGCHRSVKTLVDWGLKDPE